MSSRIRTLLLEANGTHWVAVAADTLAPSLTANAPGWVRRSPRLRKLFGDRYADASYLSDWRDAFLASPALDVDVCSITNLRDYRAKRPAIRDYDLVVILHSAAGDRMQILGHTASWFQGRRGRLAMFIGNEYALMAEKIAFARAAAVDLVCTQLPLEAARSIYQGCGAAIVAMPHALNPDIYYPVRDRRRSIDVGFVGDLYERLIGDRERTDIVRFFAEHGAARGLRCDIRHVRMPKEEWADFLRSAHAVIGAESGTYFLQRDSEALNCARRIVRKEPEATFESVKQRCFTNVRGAVNGKAISSRHFEPIGTLTCQLLIEGRYNDVLRADEHYVSVKRDLSNIDDAIVRVMDTEYRSRMTTAAYEHALAGHTYAHRVRRLVEVVAAGTQAGGGDVAVA
jgi:hypothetical protein